MTRDKTPSTRRRLTGVALVIIMLLPTVGMAAGVAAGATADIASDGRFGPGVSDVTTSWGFQYGSVPKYAVTYDGDPGWWVTVDSAEDVTALEDWAGSSEDRDVLQINADSNRVLISAPATHLGLTKVDRWLYSSGLSAMDYVDHISLVHEASIPDPPALDANRSTFAAPVSNTFVDGGFDQSSVAYPENMEPSTMREARSVLGATGDRPTGEGITIGVLDTGISTADGRVFGNGSAGSELRISASKNFLTNETGLSAVEDGNGHGTWVASAIAANHANDSYDGVAPDANLVVGKVLSDDGSGSMDSIIQGIEWMSDEQNVDVISMSLGATQYSPALAAELREALDETDVSAIVIAAGNSRQTMRYLASPGDVTGENPQSDGLITVTATNVSAPSSAASTYFSMVGPDGGIRDGSAGESRGALPTIAAPGAKIEAATPSTSGAVEYSTLSGTSMATPLISGVIGSMLDAHTDLKGDHAAVEQHLGYTATPVPNAGYTEVGAGVANLSTAVDTNDVDGGSSYYADQQSARTDTAKSRDQANAAFAGMNPFTRSLAKAASIGDLGLNIDLSI